MSRISLRSLALALTPLSFAACDAFGPKGATVQAHLMRMPTTHASFARVAAVQPGNSAGAPHWTSAVDIQSLQVPIREISITGSSAHAEIYRCDPATDANDCLVELTGPALQNLLATSPATARMGSYDAVLIRSCGGDETEYTSYITGSAQLNGATYHTRSDGGISTEGPAEPAPLVHSGCANEFALPVPAVVTDSAGAVIPVRLYFDIREIAHFGSGEPDTRGAWMPGGCTPGVDSATTPKPFVCISYPDVAGYTGAGTPNLERYRLNQTATVGIFFDPETDTALGGYTRMSYVEGVEDNSGFMMVTPVWEMDPKGDGSYVLSNYGASATEAAFRINAFRREDHSGTFNAYHPAGNQLGLAYDAVRLQ
jgi:hypothetical protein